MSRLAVLFVIAVPFTAPFLPFGVWIVAAFDAVFVGFCLAMLVSRRARFAFVGWLERRA